jgi:hypothetical protein
MPYYSLNISIIKPKVTCRTPNLNSDSKMPLENLAPRKIPYLTIFHVFGGYSNID